ncbi:MAG: radical SAM/SPASM domain-containing protein [Candidatus Woesearchaeota archaeon]
MKLNYFLSDIVYMFKLFKKILLLKISEKTKFRTLPLSLAISLTYKCNSKCKTCGIWQLNKNEKLKELTRKELKKLLNSLNKEVLWFTYTGGEPFLRKDFSEILIYTANHNTPLVINIATNGLSKTIYETLRTTLEQSNKKTKFIINFSLDEIESGYKFIRGINGFNIFLKNYNEVLKLKKKYSNFIIGINITLSKYNIGKFKKIYNYILKELKPDSLLVEPATIRFSLKNKHMLFGAEIDETKKILRFLIKKEEHAINELKGFPKLIRIMRLNFYFKCLATLENERHKNYCTAGIGFSEILPNGDVLMCGLRGGPIGNLKEFNYDFKKLWFSDSAVYKIKNFHRKNKNCILANPNYVSSLLNFRDLLNSLKIYLFNKN